MDGVPTLCTKGAIDVLLDRATWRAHRQTARALITEQESRRSADVNMQLSEKGLRVLAFAYRAVWTHECPGSLWRTKTTIPLWA